MSPVYTPIEGEGKDSRHLEGWWFSDLFAIPVTLTPPSPVEGEGGDTCRLEG